MSPKKSREIAFKLLYGLSFDKTADVSSDDAIESVIDYTPSEQPEGRELEFIQKLCAVVKDNITAIDQLIKDNSVDFSFDRIFKVDLTALRMAIGEILFMSETPNAVAVNEAVELVKKYSTEKSASYVNGILANVIKNSSK